MPEGLSGPVESEIASAWPASRFLLNQHLLLLCTAACQYGVLRVFLIVLSMILFLVFYSLLTFWEAYLISMPIPSAVIFLPNLSTNQRLQCSSFSRKSKGLWLCQRVLNVSISPPLISPCEPWSILICLYFRSHGDRLVVLHFTIIIFCDFSYSSQLSPHKSCQDPTSMS